MAYAGPPTSEETPADAAATNEPPADESAEEPRPVEEAEATPEPTATTHGKLVGTVYRWGSRDPVASARIIRADGEEGTETGPDGTFELWLEPGEHTLVIRADGLSDLPIEIEIEAGQQQEFEYRLSENLDGNRFRTVVEGEREVAISKISLRDEEIHDVPGTGGDPFGVVKSMPGTAQIAGFLPYVVVRGAAPGNTGYYLDGVRVPLLFHVAAGPSVIHPYFVDSVDFHLSGAPVRLGRFASGIVEGKTRPARRDRVRGDVDLRLTDVGALVEVPINRRVLPGCTEEKRRKCKKSDGRGALTFGGRYSYTGLVLSLIPNLNARIQFWDYQARFDHDLGPRVRYTAFAYGAYDSLGADALADQDEFGNEVIDEDPEPFLQLSFHRLVQRAHQRLRKGGEATYQVALGFDRSGADAFKTNVWRILPRIGVVIPTTDNAEIGFGLDQDFSWYRIDDASFDAEEGDIEDIGFFLSERFVSSTGVWADLRWQKGIVELRPGIRADLYVQEGASPYLGDSRSVTRAVGVDPRLTIRERVAERWTLRQAVGMYHQPPDAPIPIPGIEAFGFDRGLQRNIQGSFGYEYWIGDAAVLTQDAYLGRFDNLQDFELSDTTQTGNNEVEDYLIRVSGWAYGLETMVRLAPTLRVYGWVAYTLSRSTRDFPVGGVVPGSWDQTHIVNLILGYKLGNKWRIGGRIHFNSGRPYTRMTNANAATAAEEGLGAGLVALRDNRNNARLPPFFQFDLRAERIFVFKLWQLHAYIDAANATLSREVFACSTGSDGDGDGKVDMETRDTWGCARPQALRYILPTLGLRGRF
jgi:hypothetical protein